MMEAPTYDMTVAGDRCTRTGCTAARQHPVTGTEFDAVEYGDLCPDHAAEAREVAVARSAPRAVAAVMPGPVVEICEHPECSDPRGEDDRSLCPAHRRELEAYRNSPEGRAAAKRGQIERLRKEIAQEKEYQLVRREARRELDREEREILDPEPPAMEDLGDLLDEPDEEVRYLIKGLWPSGGRVILAAPQKAGKTTLIGNLVKSLADGVPFLGRFEVDASAELGGIALLDFEMPRDMLKRWLRAQGIVNRKLVRVISLRGKAHTFDIRDPEIRAMWAKRFRDDGIGIIIGDPIKPLADALDVSEHTEMGSLLVAFDALLREADAVAGMWTHHFGHEHERGRGDSTLRGWPDVEWKLLTERDRETGERDMDKPVSFWAFGRDVDQRAAQLEYEPGAHRLALADDGNGGVVPRREVSARQHMDVIEAFIAEHPGCSRNEIKRGLPNINLSRGKPLERLVEAKRIMKKPAEKGSGDSYVTVPTSEGVEDAFDNTI